MPNFYLSNLFKSYKKTFQASNVKTPGNQALYDLLPSEFAPEFRKLIIPYLQNEINNSPRQGSPRESVRGRLDAAKDSNSMGHITRLVQLLPISSEIAVKELAKMVHAGETLSGVETYITQTMTDLCNSLLNEAHDDFNDVQSCRLINVGIDGKLPTLDRHSQAQVVKKGEELFYINGGDTKKLKVKPINPDALLGASVIEDVTVEEYSAVLSDYTLIEKYIDKNAKETNNMINISQDEYLTIENYFSGWDAKVNDREANSKELNFIIEVTNEPQIGQYFKNEQLFKDFMKSENKTKFIESFIKGIGLLLQRVIAEEYNKEMEDESCWTLVEITKPFPNRDDKVALEKILKASGGRELIVKSGSDFYRLNYELDAMSEDRVEVIESKKFNSPNEEDKKQLADMFLNSKTIHKKDIGYNLIFKFVGELPSIRTKVTEFDTKYNKVFNDTLETFDVTKQNVLYASSSKTAALTEYSDEEDNDDHHQTLSPG